MFPVSETATIFDISPVISPRIAVWPGDTQFSARFLCKIAEGSNIDLSTIETTVHVGAHCDAPSHYVLPGQTIEQRDLRYYLGRCQVISVDVDRASRVQLTDINITITAPRVLLRTSSFPDPDQFNEDFAASSPELIDWLAAQGVVLIGIDTPSIDLCDSKLLPSHKAVARHDMAVLEGVVLDVVPDGVYWLSAVPLRIEGADASPVRAVLMSL